MLKFQRRRIAWMKEKWKISDLGIAYLSFLKGLIIGGLLVYWLMQ